MQAVDFSLLACLINTLLSNNALKMPLSCPFIYLFFFLESSQQLCSQSLSVRIELAQMATASAGLTSTGVPAIAPAQQQQISAAEQKSRMDLQMSTALHGTAAFTTQHHLRCCLRQNKI